MKNMRLKWLFEITRCFKKSCGKQDLVLKIILNNDAKTCFYTGLPSFALFNSLFEILIGYTCPQPDSKGFYLFIVVLVKLCLNIPIEFLADRLDISKAQFSAIIHMLLDAHVSQFAATYLVA